MRRIGLFTREDCQGCGLIVSGAHVHLVQVDPKAGIEGWKFLCQKCRRDLVKEAGIL